MSTDVIIVDYNSHELLSRALSTLCKWNKDSLGRVWVVENGELEQESAFTKRFPWVTWIKNGQNLGFARGVNQALSRVESPYLCLLNPDAWLTGPLLGPAEKWLDDHPDVGILGPMILNEDGSIQGSARSFPSLSTAFFGRTTLFSRLFPGNRFTRKNLVATGEVLGPTEVEWVSGACMFVRSQAARHVGPMDERFFLYWEDCDWCTRFRKKGWKVVYHPGLGPLVHSAGGTSKKVKLFSLYHFHKSAVTLYRKYDKTPLRLGSVAATLGGCARFSILALKVLAEKMMDLQKVRHS